MASSSSPSEDGPVHDPAQEPEAVISRYYFRLRRAIARYIPSSSGFFSRISNLYSPGYATRARRRKPGLPLPFRSRALACTPVMSEISAVIGVLDDVLEHTLMNLHQIQKNLQFWQSRAEGTDARKVYFMVFERGPRAFISESVNLISKLREEGSPIRRICYSAAASICGKIAVLNGLQNCLATFAAQVYVEADRYEELLIKDPGNALSSLLVNLNTLFLKLEASINYHAQIHKIQFSTKTGVNSSNAFLFEGLPGTDNEQSQWSHADIKDATDLIYRNLHKLDSYVSFLVAEHQKPRKMTLYWLQYTCGAVGFSICTMWLLRHSRLMGSPDIENWLLEAKESTAAFWESHVEQPLLSIRDELFETFKRRHKGVIELEEVRLTADSLHRMLLTFSEQTKGQKFPENASDQEMLEIVMSRYEKELMHPIQNLFSGEIARALLIQIQKLKLDIETAMLELDQILKANEINFAILAALPAFFISLILLMLVRAWVLQDKGAEGRGRVARLQRRLLVADIEKKIMRFQSCLDKGLEEDARCMFGMVLYSLDRLYKAAEKHARETGEWLSLRQDILDIANPGLKTEHKLVLTSRMERVYECMLPSLRKH